MSLRQGDIGPELGAVQLCHSGPLAAILSAMLNIESLVFLSRGNKKTARHRGVCSGVHPPRTVHSLSRHPQRLNERACATIGVLTQHIESFYPLGTSVCLVEYFLGGPQRPRQAAALIADCQRQVTRACVARTTPSLAFICHALGDLQTRNKLLSVNTRLFGLDHRKCGTYSTNVQARIQDNVSLGVAGGETGDPRENPTSGIFRHDSHLQKSGVIRPGIEPGSAWWDADFEIVLIVVWLYYLHLMEYCNTARLQPRRTGFNPRPGHSPGISRFPRSLHSGAATFSPDFTLIGSQDLVVKNRPNLSTQWHRESTLIREAGVVGTKSRLCPGGVAVV
ncbi:hypothetical protein PR048_021435 [Dryococelus australis]|uniref:Uncharacterized protein n=1 Tax=Dryococelus australis TaxID=614101 RepID=A0ABQ9GYD5_9NEOP|nr:hypothetical protein PR048_021435 [Dryococelus australis]